MLHQAFEGLATNVERRYRETQSDASRKELEEYMAECPCPDCGGHRLRPEALAVTVGGKSIHQVSGLPVDESIVFFVEL